ncbi:type II secretion system F family protein [Actinoplanes solisilvae]|uniref:type II secretion system F family protein n=1 Tax=Actinoplanes solisilvae TaxID=2486853 RepID=UPI001F0CB334|nr:hypothetical protein [Actinoplanes solisilvae]
MIWGPLLLILGALALAWPGGRLWRLPKVPIVALAGRAVARMERAPRQALGAAVGGAALLGLLGGGPVAGIVAGAYAAIGGRALMRRSLRQRVAAERAAALDGLASLAADLRAGLPAVALPETENRLGRLTASVSHLAERTGAPAADLVERIEADARAVDRAGASASAQAAGAQATSMLLAALPVAGIGLGFLMGANPFAVLLHTPLGAACALVAVALQTVGLLWSERLMSGVTR